MGKPDFKYRPKLLCVGRRLQLSYEVFFTQDDKVENGTWSKLKQEFLEENPQMAREIYKKTKLDPDGDTFYKACKLHPTKVPFLALFQRFSVCNLSTNGIRIYEENGGCVYLS